MLNASLAGWKDSYCDTEDTYKSCARFEASLSGNPVPLALLPNGKVIGGVVVDDAVKAKASQVKVASAAELSSGSVAVLDDTHAEAVLEEAQTASFWKRLTGLFGAFK
jgi:hypothetical protein